MRRRRPQSVMARAAGVSGAAVLDVWTAVARRPIDAVAVATAVILSLIIVINAIFLQSGMRAPPFLDNAKLSNAKGDPLKPLVTNTASRPVVASPAPQPVASRRTDAINELIGPSSRIVAVQRALSEFGYGQLKPTGIMDEATAASIQKFEREHNLPGTGRVSDRLVRELAAMVGHPIE